MPKKLTLTQAQQVFEDGDATLLDTEYKNARQEVFYDCHRCGARNQEMVFADFKNGHRTCCGNLSRKKYTLDSARKIFKDGAATLLATRYENNQTKMPYHCHRCGRSDYEMSLASFQYGHRACCGQKKKFKVKEIYTLKSVRKIFRDGEATLLATKYENNYTKMPYQCHRCGKKDEIALNPFKSGSRNCCKSPKYTLESVKIIFEDGEALLLSTEYENSTTKMLYQCRRCRQEKLITLHAFNLGIRPCCGQNTGHQKKTFTLEQAQQIFQDGEATLLAKDYTSARTKMPYHCHRCGQECRVRLAEFQGGTRPCCGWVEGGKVKSKRSRARHMLRLILGTKKVLENK